MAVATRAPAQSSGGSPKAGQAPQTARVGGPDSTAIAEIGATPATTPTAETQVGDPAANAALADRMAKDQAAGNIDGAIRDAAAAEVVQKPASSPASTAESQEIVLQSREDLVITSHISALENQIKAAQQRKENTQAHEQLLITLRLAKEPTANVLMKLNALQQLKTAGVAGLDDVIAETQSRAVEASVGLAALLHGIDPTLDAQKLQEDFAKNGFNGETALKLLSNPQLEGMDTVLLGREITQEELEQMKNTRLIPEAKKKYGGLLLLLLMLGFSLGGSAFSSLTGEKR